MASKTRKENAQQEYDTSVRVVTREERRSSCKDFDRYNQENSDNDEYKHLDENLIVGKSTSKLCSSEKTSQFRM